MTQTAINYAKALYELKIPRQIIMDTKQAFIDVPELTAFFMNPTISLESKYDVIDKIFSKEIKNFLKVLCNYQSVGEIINIFQAYEDYEREKQNKILAKLYYVNPPNENQLEKLQSFLCNEFGVFKAEIVQEEKPELLGGFVLLAGDKEYDWSIKGRFEILKQKLTWR